MCLMKKPDSTNSDLILLEKSLILFFRPSFLHITNPDENNDIQVILSTRHFNQKTVQERIIMVYNVIKQNCPIALNDRLVITQAYSPLEMDEILEYVFNDDNDKGEK